VTATHAITLGSDPIQVPILSGRELTVTELICVDNVNEGRRILSGLEVCGEGESGQARSCLLLNHPRGQPWQNRSLSNLVNADGHGPSERTKSGNPLK